MRRYKVAFDPWGFLLFGGMMLPNLYWFAVPAPNDVLRAPSATPLLDGAASLCQILFAAALCLLAHRRRAPLRLTPLLGGTVCCGLLYAAGWICYYAGLVSPAVILLLTLSPCLAFLFFSLDRRNGPAAILISVFALCHALHGVINFIL